MSLQRRIDLKKIKADIEGSPYSQKKMILKFIKKNVKSINVDYSSETGDHVFIFNLDSISEEDITSLKDLLKP